MTPSTENAGGILNRLGGLVDLPFLKIPGGLVDRTRLPRDEYLNRLRAFENAAPSWPTLPGSTPEFQTAARGGREVISYITRYQPVNTDAAASLLADPNRLGYINLWRSAPKPKKKLILCLHGFRMGSPRRAHRMFRIPKLLEAGLDVGLYIAPFHWRRAPDPRRFYFLNPSDLPLTIDTFGQALHDLHSAALLLQAMGYERIGVIGASLGGYLAALYASFSAPVDFMFTAVPAVDMWDQLKPSPGRLPFPADEEIFQASRSALQMVTPLYRSPVFAMDKFMVMAHRGDRLCQWRHTGALIDKWGIENHREVAGGHWLYLDRKARGQAWWGWLEKMGYLG